MHKIFMENIGPRIFSIFVFFLIFLMASIWLGGNSWQQALSNAFYPTVGAVIGALFLAPILNQIQKKEDKKDKK